VANSFRNAGVFGELMEQARGAFVVVESSVSMLRLPRVHSASRRGIEIVRRRSRTDGIPVRRAVPIRVAGVKIQDHEIGELGKSRQRLISA